MVGLTADSTQQNRDLEDNPWKVSNLSIKKIKVGEIHIKKKEIWDVVKRSMEWSLRRGGKMVKKHYLNRNWSKIFQN